MKKYIIECPSCGTYNEVTNSLFGKKEIKCSCGHIIDIKKDRVKAITCPHCQNIVAYDQSKGDKAICPVCKKNLFSKNGNGNTTSVICPTCGCKLDVDKFAASYVCPLCDTEIDVQKELKKQQIKESKTLEVIKYEGSNDVLIWKHPFEDFKYGSQLIVHESQEAIFFKDGQALDTFGAGRYTLETQNIPLLKEVYKLPFDNNSVFHSEIYFINLTTQMGIKWGTDSKIRLFDPASGLHVELGACGQFSIRINNGRKLLLKVVGTTNGFAQGEVVGGNDYSTKGMVGKFKALVVSKVKSLLAKTIREQAISILEIDEYLEPLSALLKDSINLVLNDYGLEMPEFYITTILTPDDDPNFKKMKEQYAEQYLLVRQEQIKKNVAMAEQQRKIVEAQTSAQEEVIAAQAKAEAYRLQAEAEAKEMQMKGYTYQQETQRQVAVAAMENQGGTGNIPGVVNNMVGLGVGLGVMGEVANNVKNAIKPAFTPVNNGEQSNQVDDIKNNDAWECPNCHYHATTAFCPQCGFKKPVAENQTWDCQCGQKGITTPFCPNCGHKRGE